MMSLLFNRLTVVFIFVVVSTMNLKAGNSSDKSESGIKQPKAILLEEIKVTDLGLYFEGEKDVDFRFSSRITPHGDCIDAVGDYVFFTWYKGGMDKRNLMLSRMKIGSGKIYTIEFPDQLIGFRGDSTKGDSHNTASVGICELDNTIHLMYDMHVYSKTNCPTHSFNYRTSVKNAATVPDSLWNLDLFYPKRNYLKEGVFYENITYPQFVRVDDGNLLAKFRIGGAGNGDNIYAIYDGKSWSDNIKFNNGNQPEKENMYSIYGGFQYLHGTLYSGFSVRYAYRQDEYVHNNGFFLASHKNGKWYNNKGAQLSFPLQNPIECKIGEPCELGLGYKLSGGTNWTITKNGAVHFTVLVSGNPVHYFKSAQDTAFTYASNTAYGSLFNLGEYVYAVDLVDGYLNIFATPEGKNEWENIYKDSVGKVYRHFNVKVLNNKLFVYLMESKYGDKQPLILSTFLLKD
jgi:hypothetical protein